MKLAKVTLATFLGVSLALGTMMGSAEAGRGGSSHAIFRAISSGSVDAIQAELERAEFLVCGACVDMVRPLVDSPNYKVRQVAAWWLARRAVASQVRVEMLNRLAQPDSTAARNAADVLGEFHYASSIPALGAALSNPIFTGEARAAMARALGTINRPAVVQPLTDALGSTDAQVKTAALAALQLVNAHRDGTAVIPLVSDSDVGVRATAATTLGMFRDASGTDALVNALRNDPSASVRKQAAWALGAVRARSATAGPALQQAAANDQSPVVRSLAAAALTRLSN